MPPWGERPLQPAPSQYPITPERAILGVYVVLRANVSETSRGVVLCRGHREAALTDRPIGPDPDNWKRRAIGSPTGHAEPAAWDQSYFEHSNWHREHGQVRRLRRDRMRVSG